jgi:hypothetical protein
LDAEAEPLVWPAAGSYWFAGWPLEVRP